MKRDTNKMVCVTGLIAMLISFLFVSGCSGLMPKGMQGRINENVASDSMVAVRKAEVEFNRQHDRYGTLDEMKKAGLIDAGLANSANGGYEYQFHLDAEGYTFTAKPNKYLETGITSYYLDQTGVIRFSNSAKPADVHDARSESKN